MTIEPPEPPKRGRSAPKPQPVRASAPSEEPPNSTKPYSEDVRIRVQGTEWVVTVLGRSVGGGRGLLHLLLLGFKDVGSSDGEGEREVLTAGRELNELSAAALEHAFSLSAPRSHRIRSPSFFAEATERRRS